MDLYPICSECNTILKEESDEHSCNYWFHREKHYGSSIVQESYCGDCITKHRLYDGRIESVCKRCQRYVTAFNYYPKFLEICIELFREADGLDIMEIIGNEKIKEIFINIENNILPENPKETLETLTLEDILGENDSSIQIP